MSVLRERRRVLIEEIRQVSALLGRVSACRMRLGRQHPVTILIEPYSSLEPAVAGPELSLFRAYIEGHTTQPWQDWPRLYQLADDWRLLHGSTCSAAGFIAHLFFEDHRQAYQLFLAHGVDGCLRRLREDREALHRAEVCEALGLPSDAAHEIDPEWFGTAANDLLIRVSTLPADHPALAKWQPLRDALDKWRRNA